MKKIICVLCITVLLVMSLTACKGQSLDGSYKLVEMETGGEDISSVLKSVNILMEIEADHAVLNFAGQMLEWEVDTETGVMRSSEGMETPYSVEDNRIILESEADGTNSRMVFEKQENPSASE